MTMELLEIHRMKEDLLHSEYVDAIFKTGTILGLGTVFYMGWFAYEFFTNAEISIRNSLGDVVETDFPPVNPWLKTDEALKDYSIAIGGQNVVVKVYGGNHPTTTTLNNQKVSAFKDAQQFIKDDGGFTGYTSSYYMVKEAEAVLVKAGYIKPEEIVPMHPVDRVANWVVHDKWYWGGVLGLSAVPIVLLSVKTLKSMEGDMEL